MRADTQVRPYGILDIDVETGRDLFPQNHQGHPMNPLFLSDRFAPVVIPAFAGMTIKTAFAS